MSAPANPFTLADWRHTVAEHYAAVRALAELAATGWWTVHDPAALERADAAELEAAHVPRRRPRHGDHEVAEDIGPVRPNEKGGVVPAVGMTALALQTKP